ncbi:MAG: hypothetical protein Q9195_000704 [Heterodermia aff. obscurata]
MSPVPNHAASVSPTPFSYNVAIVGGGIGGLTLALGLLKYPHIDVQIYESASSFGWIGAGVAIGPNGQKALEIISPAAKAAFDEHATPNMWPSKAKNFAAFIVGKGERAGEVILEAKNETGMQSVHRADFLDELVKAVPAERAHFNKCLQKIEDKDGRPVVIRFSDETSVTADVVIGADGIHSNVRKYLLGTEAAKPVFSGYVAYRGIINMDAAVEALGAEHAQNSTLICGPGRAIFTYPINRGALVNVAAMDFDHPIWEHEKWIVPTDWSIVSQRFEGWSSQAQAVIKVWSPFRSYILYPAHIYSNEPPKLLDKPDLATWAFWDTAPASTYTRGRVAMLGDAAHATTPFQGQGAGQAIEDSEVIMTVLSKVQNLKQIPNALMAYNQVRRPRAQRVVETSREFGKLLGMQSEGVGEDIEKMKEHLETRMHWLWQRNQTAQLNGAVELFEESL